MRRTIGWMTVLLPALIVVGGCARHQAADPDTRLQAEITRYGLPEVVARAKEQAAKESTAANYDYLARAYAAARRSQEARKALEKAVSLDPTYPSSAVTLARVLTQENKPADAERMMRALLQKAPDNAEAAELLCRAELMQGRADEAAQTAAQALKRNRKAPELLWAEADALAILKRFEESQKDYQRAMEVDPNNVPLRMSYVRTLVAMRRQDEAAKLATETLKLAPNSANVHFMAASTLHQAGQLDAALKEYKETLIIDPSMVAAANNLALLLADRNQDTGTAVAWARKAVRIDHRNVAVEDTLGWALARDGQYDEAIRILRLVSTVWPDNPTVWYHLGWALAKSGQKAEGIKLLQRAAAANSDASADAQKALQELS